VEGFFEMTIMSYIFLDESGDLGFSFDKGSSRYFVVVAVVVDNKRQLEKIVRRVHDGLVKKYRVIGTLHACKEKDSTIISMLKRLNESSLHIFAAIFNKAMIFNHQRSNINTLYNSMVCLLLNRVVIDHSDVMGDNLIVVASRRSTSRYINNEFELYMTKYLVSKNVQKFNIKIATPTNEKSLQVADFVSWAIYRRHEFNDDTFYSIIEPQIVDEFLDPS